MISDPNVVQIARNKLETSKVLSACGILTPRTWSISQIRDELPTWDGRVVCKPRCGSASEGIQIAGSLRVAARLPLDDTYIVQELLEGKEYTVNVFFDRFGKVRCAISHWRIEVRSGEVAKGMTERLGWLDENISNFEKALPGAQGPICFQMIQSESGKYGTFEINARFGGGYPLAHSAGARFSQWLLEESAGLPSHASNRWREGVLMFRYDAAIFRGA